MSTLVKLLKTQQGVAKSKNLPAPCWEFPQLIKNDRRRCQNPTTAWKPPVKVLLRPTLKKTKELVQEGP